MTLPGKGRASSLADVVQANTLGGNTCRVTVTTPDGRGVLHIENGAIVDAVLGDLVGEPAFYALVNAQDTEYSVSSGVKASVRRIDRGFESLMLDAMTLRFEGRVPRPASPSTSAVPLAERTVTLPRLPETAMAPRVPGPLPVVPSGPGLAPAPLPREERRPSPTPPASAAPPARAKGRSRAPWAIGALLLLTAGGGAFLLAGRGSRSAVAASSQVSSIPAPPPAEPVEAGELTGADDLLPVLESGQPPRSPDPDSAVSPTIVCRILVGTDGAVREASIFRSRLDLAKFEEAALSTVKSYRFRPGRRGGRTVPVWINYPVTFS